MPYFPHTPEALLGRSDSRNPHSTCNGLTSNGRPCRRAISKSPNSSPLRSASPERYCWQHKEQGVEDTARSAAVHKTQKNGLGPLKERTSVDTLVDRLGLLEIDKKRKARVQGDPEKRRSEGRPKPRPKPNSTSNLALFCCIGSADITPPARSSAQNNRKKQTASVQPSTPPRSNYLLHMQHHQHQNLPPQDHLSLHSPPHTPTTHLLSLIPPTTPPSTASLLLAELSKPPTQSDAPGYIYIFWLTSSSASTPPPTETAPSLLLAPASRPSPGHRRTSDVINTFASTSKTTKTTKESPAAPKTILLKIGRAQNVHRRLSQWTRQCGYDLSLIRYYPYQPTSPPLSTSASPSRPEAVQANESEPRKVPFAHKVERLIHIELTEKRARDAGTCRACGREHREWFEVEASRRGVREVDEVVRRWVGWGEGLG